MWYNIAAMENEEIKSEDSAADASAAEETQQQGAEAAGKGDAAMDAPHADGAEEPAQPAEEPASPDWKGMYARTLADFDNFRKRTARDREDLVKSAAAGVLKDVLNTVDNLARALGEAASRADDPFVAGVKLIYEGLLKTLADHGASPLDAKGEPFDANFHEALAQLPSTDVPEGNVIDEVKRGWLLNGKLLRAAQVVVSSGAPEQAGAPAETDETAK